MIKTVNKITGEVIELPTDKLTDLVSAWELAKELEKIGKQIKEEIKQYALPHLNSFDETEVVGKHKFKRVVIQRYTYDKSAVRNILEDEDLIDDFLIIDKPALDLYIKGNLAELGELSTQLRETMIPSGKPYEMFKLEKA